jgi:hypothetical protein
MALHQGQSFTLNNTHDVTGYFSGFLFVSFKECPGDWESVYLTSFLRHPNQI